MLAGVIILMASGIPAMTSSKPSFSLLICSLRSSTPVLDRILLELAATERPRTRDGTLFCFRNAVTRLRSASAAVCGWKAWFHQFRGRSHIPALQDFLRAMRPPRNVQQPAAHAAATMHAPDHT